VDSISLGRLALAFLPVFIVIAVLRRWSLPATSAFYALTRMLGQLLLVGYVLTFIFGTEQSWVVLVVLAVMITASSWIALGSVPERRGGLYVGALISIALGGGCVLVLITVGVLTLNPWYDPRYMVPLAGMIFAASMNAVSLAAERLYAELSRGESYVAARNKASHAALIPVINSLLAVGLVSLPGMMTGQILAGVSPLVAARYQIMVMCMLFAAAGLSVILFLWREQAHEFREE